MELFWIPVGAGTSRAQRASLRLWETFEAARCRRPRATLYHAALKLRPGDGAARAVELAPALVPAVGPVLMAGPVGVRAAGRLRLFRYELRCAPVDRLPDEAWAVASPVVLSREGAVARRLLELAPAVPAHTWGRRVPGTGEMWTSDSAIAWLLARGGLAVTGIAPPAGGRAPGWFAGLALAEGGGGQSAARRLR